MWKTLLLLFEHLACSRSAAERGLFSGLEGNANRHHKLIPNRLFLYFHPIQQIQSCCKNYKHLLTSTHPHAPGFFFFFFLFFFPPLPKDGSCETFFPPSLTSVIRRVLPHYHSFIPLKILQKLYNTERQ